MRGSGIRRRTAKVLALTAIAASGATAASALPAETGGGTATPYANDVGSLTINGVKGANENKIQTMTIYGYSFGVTNSGVSGYGGGGGSGKSKASDLTFVKHLDASTPGLFLAASNGNRLKSARLDVDGGGGADTIASYCFDRPVITSVRDEADGIAESSPPLETVSFTFAAVSVSFAITDGFREYVASLPFGRGGPRCSNQPT